MSIKKYMINSAIVISQIIAIQATEEAPSINQAKTKLDTEINSAKETMGATGESFQALTNNFSAIIASIATTHTSRSASINDITSKFQVVKNKFYELRDKLVQERQTFILNGGNINENITQLQQVIAGLETDKNNLAAQINQLQENYNNLLAQNSADAAEIISKIGYLTESYQSLALQKSQFISDIQTIIDTLSTHASNDIADNNSLITLIDSMNTDINNIQAWLNSDSNL